MTKDRNSPYTDADGCRFSKRAIQFDPYDAAYQLDPAAALRWSHEEEPVFYSE